MVGEKPRSYLQEEENMMELLFNRLNAKLLIMTICAFAIYAVFSLIPR
tara:strand:- start:1365 stop:1508 length:144 start_codon:yes stop_codon:yes gene_type:complete